MRIMVARSLLRRVGQPILAAFCVALLALAAQAQEVAEAPARVGRVALVDGKLFHTPPGGADAWTEIGVNVPIAEGDDLWTEAGSLAEIDYGGGQFRLAGQTNLHVSRLDDHELALFVASGSVIVRVRYLEAGDRVIVDTPSTQAALARPGLYRIDVNADPPETAVVVRLGQADVTTVRGAEAIYPGEMAVLAGTSDVTVDIGKAGGVDLFDTWSAQRDRVYERRDAQQYVSPQMVGSYDLDDYGTWQRYPEYGAVWFPTVDPGWAPYRFGHWTWLRDYGYAWVDDAPWGYAPFHYGRWAYIGGRWGWCPGAYVRRPAWAPALVVWYGGPSWTYVAGGAPVYGWVPLGWGEAYVPAWRGCASRCYSRYNRPFAVDVSRRVPEPPPRPVNLRAPGGMTAVPAATLATGRPVPINRVDIPAAPATIPPALVAPPAVAPIVAKPLVRPGGAVPPPAGAIARTTPGVALPPRAPAGASAVPRTPLPPTVVPRAGAPMTAIPPATTPPAATVPGTTQPPTPGGLRVAPRPTVPAPAAPAIPTAPLRAVPPPAAVPAPQRVPAAPAPAVPSLLMPATPTLRSAPTSPVVPQPVAPPRIAPGPPAVVPAPVAPAPPAVVPRPAPPPAAPAPRPVAPPPPTGS
jgi:hypothetical protein